MAKKSPWNNAIEEENKQNRTVASQNTIAGTRSTPWNNAVQTGNPQVEVNRRRTATEVPRVNIPNIPQFKDTTLADKAVNFVGGAIGTGIAQTLSGASNLVKSVPVVAETGARAISNLAKAPVSPITSNLTPSEIDENSLTNQLARALKSEDPIKNTVSTISTNLLKHENEQQTVDLPKTEQDITKNRFQNVANREMIAQGEQPVRQITEWTDPWNKALSNSVDAVQEIGQTYNQAVSPVTDLADNLSQQVSDITEREFLANMNPAEQFVVQSLGNVLPNMTRHMLLGAMSGGSTELLGTLSDIVMFGSGFYDGYEDALARGLSTEEAMMNGVTRGAIEAGTEHISDIMMFDGGTSALDDAILEKIALSNMNPGQKFMARGFSGGFGEGLEEGAASVLNTLADRGIYGDKINVGQLLGSVFESAGSSFISTMALGLLGGEYSGKARQRWDNYVEQTQNQHQRELQNETDKHLTEAALMYASMDDAQKAQFLAQAQEQIAQKFGADDPIANMDAEELKNWVDRNAEKQIMGLSEEQYAKYVDRMNGTEMPVASMTLPNGQDYDIYEYLGVRNPSQDRAVDLAKRWGKNIIIADELPPGINAVRLDDGTIAISANAQRPATALVFHEMFHDLKENGQWEDLLNLAKESMISAEGNNGFNTYMNDLLKRYTPMYGKLDNAYLSSITLSKDLTDKQKQEAKDKYKIEQGTNLYLTNEAFRDKIDEEVAGEFMERFNNEDSIKAMYNRSGNLFERTWQNLSDAVKNFAGTLTKDEQNLKKTEQLFAKIAQGEAEAQERFNTEPVYSIDENRQYYNERFNDRDGRVFINDLSMLSTNDWKTIQKAVDKLGYGIGSAEAAREAFSRYVPENGFNTEQSNAIRKAFGVDEAEKKQGNIGRANLAKVAFGTTSNFNEAGYLLQDGKMLDFSGKREGGPPNQRAMDHRDIARVFDEELGDGSSATAYMNKFIDEGNIRLMPEQGVTIGEQEPTSAQYAVLKRFVEHMLDNEGFFYLDIQNENGNTIADREYGKGDKSSRIINDIKAYFKDGELPYRSQFADYRYSLSEDDMKMLGIRPDSYWDDKYMDAVNRGDMEEAQRLRNLHAADAGYDPNTWYHGTGEYFNEFNLGGEGIHLGNNEQARQIARERFNNRSMTTMYKWDRIRDDLENLADTNIDLLYNVAQELIDVNYELLENPIEDEFDENIIYDENIPIEDVIDQLREYGDKISDEFLKEVNYDHDISVRIPTYDREVGEHVMRLYTDNANPFYVNGDIESWTPERIAEMLLRRNEGEDRMLTHPYGDVFADITGSDISLDADEQEILWDILNGDVKGDEAWEDINSLLLSNGYTGIEYLNKYEGDRNSPSRLVMNPTGVKSADAVTYDDNGNVIPLSQRDNPLNPDIRYSLNDMGEPLSEGQQEYFRNSVVRNADGNLKVMYHGSDIEFNEFDKNKIRSVDYDAPFNGFWFSSDPNTSPAMHDAKVTRAFYLNITNPAPSDVYDRVDREIDESYTRAIRAAFGEDGTQGLYDDDANDRLQRELINEGWHEGSRSMNDELRYRLQDMGYDGIHWDGVPDINWEELSTNGITNFRTLQGRNRQLEKFSHGDVFNDLAERYPDAFTLNYGNGEYIVDYGNRNDFERLQEEVWVAFEPNQIKRTDNLNPSESNDIRYSLDEEQTLERRPYQTNGVTGEDLRPYIKGLLNEDGQVALTAENHDSFEKSIKRQIRKLVDNAVWNIEDANNAKLTINKSKTVNALYEALIEKRCDIHDIENSFARNNINIYGEREINGVNRRSSANNTFLEVLLGYMGFDGIQNPESGKTLSRDENGQRQIIEDSMNLNAETPQQREDTVQRLAEAMQTEPVVEDIPEQANRYKAKDNPQGRAANIFLGKLSRERNAADPYTYESITPESFPVPDRIQDYIDLINDEEDRKYGFDAPIENELTDEDKDFYQGLVANKTGALQGFATPTQTFNAIAKGEQREELRDRFERPMYETKKEYNANREQRWNALENMIKETGIQANTPESAAVQWYGEGVKPNEQGETIPYTLDDLKREFPNKWQDIQKMERFMREMYDEYVGRINAALEQVYPNLEEKAQAQLQSWRNKKMLYQDEISMSRNPSANEYWQNEINKLDAKIAKLEGDLESGEYFRNKRLNPRKDYFHHFQEVETSGLGGLKNILQASTLIDPELVGKSEFTKPKSKWMAWLQKRGEGAYTADAVLGMGKYIDSAEYAIAFDPLIAQYRDEISKMVKATRETKNANQLIQYLSAYTNQLAGKTASLDRTILDLLGEGNRGKLFNVLSAINNRAKSNAVVGNVRSAVAQIFNIPNALGIIKSNNAWLKGANDYINAKLGNRELLDQSPFLQERYFSHNVDDLKARNTNWEKIIGKAGDITNKMMEFGDREATELIWLAAYNEGLEKNVSDPIYYADDLTRRSVAGRGIGEVPYNMKSKVASFFMPFQVETNNAWQELKQNLRDKDANGIFRLMLGSYILNGFAKLLFNDGVVPDVLGALIDGIGKLFDKDREESVGEVALNTGKRIAGEAVSYIPGTSLWLPAIMSDESAEALFGDSDPTRYGTGTVGLSTITKTLADAVDGGDFDLVTPLLQMGLPYGGRQASRLYNTLQDFNVLPSNGVMNTPIGGEKNPVAGDYTQAGALKYRLPEEVNSAADVAEIARALAFGSNSTNAASEYYDTLKPVLSKERVAKLREHPEVNPGTYIDYLNEASTDGKQGITQQEAYDWISSHNLSDEEANALWEMTSSSWKKSYDEYQPKEETPTETSKEEKTENKTEKKSGNPTNKKEFTAIADSDGNGSLKQAEAYAWLNDQKLSDAEKEALWNLMGWKTDYETYASKH